MGITLKLGIFVFAVQFLACIIKGLCGFGNPLFSNPVLAMELDNKVITPMQIPIDWLLNLILAVKNKKYLNWKITIPVSICVMIGVVPGALCLKLSTPWILKTLLGLFVIGLGIEMWTRKVNQKHQENRILMIVLSIASGFTAGLYGINMIFMAYIERTSKNRQEFRSNVCFIMLLENTFRILVYIVTGIFTRLTLILTAIALPAALLGLMAGSRLSLKFSDDKIKKVTIIIFIIGGISILIKSLIYRS